MAVDINSLLKQYTSPWDTSFSYVDASGNVLGKGYDSYEDAIRKLAFTSGLTYQAPSAATWEWTADGLSTTPEVAAGYGHSALQTPVSTEGVDMFRTNPGQMFATEQELYDSLMGMEGSPLTFESREKYGRDLTEGQLQNMYALYAGGKITGPVNDWRSSRLAYFNPDNVSGVSLSGDLAMIGSEPVFGEDGKITGYKVNMNPAHINGADTSGRVKSSSNGATIFNPSMLELLTPAGGDYALLNVADVGKFGYKSIGNSTYSKEKNFMDKYMPGVIISASLAGLGGALSGAGWATGAAEGAAGLGGAAGGVGSINPALAESFASMYSPAAWAAPAGAAAGATGGTGMFDWIGDAGSWISDLFGGGGGSGATEFASSIASAADPIEAMYQTMAATGTTSVTDAAAALGFNSANAMLGAINPSWLSAGSSFLTDAAKQAASKLASGGGSTGLLSGGLQAIGGYLSGNAATDAAKTSAQAQLEAARIAADAAKFKPVGVTTRFGQSQFTKDAQGNVTSAGYNMPADIKAMQDSLLGAAPGMLSQFTGSMAATAPMGDAAQRMMTLGNSYLATDPQAQAQKYYNDQQAIMATERARQEAGTLTGEFNRGTYGLATGGTGMMGAANPRLEAMYNAQRQQDLQAAAQATQGGMDYAKFGSTMTGLGGDMLKSMYGTQAAAYNPYATAMTGAQNIEGLGQNALDMSVNIGKTASPAQSGQLLGQGMLGATQTMQQANQYSPWGTALMNAGNALNTMQQPQQQQTSGYMFNPFTGVRL